MTSVSQTQDVDARDKRGHDGGESLVIVPRDALLRDAAVLDRRREHHAVAELLDHAALDLLPGRLARREVIAALLLERSTARRDLRLRHQHIDSALVEVDPDAVAGLEEGQSAAGRRLGRGVEDGG